MTTINIGDDVRIFGTVLLGGVPTDPVTMKITVTRPDTSTFFYEYPTDPEVVRDGVGQFHYDLGITQAGAWTWAWDSDNSFVATGDGELEVADPATVATVDTATPTPNAVPFADWQLRDSQLQLVAEGQTDVAGESALNVDDGSYQLTAEKLGWKFEPVNLTITGAGPHTMTAVGSQRLASWLHVADIESCIGAGNVDRLFCDNNSGLRDGLLLERIMQDAEGIAESRMLRGWSSAQVATLALNDDSFRRHAAWVACELATERKGEFISDDGKGRYWAQYERALDHFEQLSKSKIHSRGEAAAGQNANTGGARRPALESNVERWTFAEDGEGNGPGGF